MKSMTFLALLTAFTATVARPAAAQEGPSSALAPGAGEVLSLPALLKSVAERNSRLRAMQASAAAASTRVAEASTYHWSVTTAIGFVALAGVAAETGVIMLIYLRQSWADRIRRGQHTLAGLHDAIMEGAVLRVRRIAAPMVGGMVSATILTLVVIPAIYSLWHEALVRTAARQEDTSTDLQPVGAN